MIRELFTRTLFVPQVQTVEKTAVLSELIEVLYDAGVLTDKSEFLRVVLEREAASGTGIGMGIAIPHGKSAAVLRPALLIAKSREGISYGSSDDQAVYLIFLIAVPEENAELHLKLLSELSRKLAHRSVREQLLKAEHYDAVLKALE